MRFNPLFVILLFFSIPAHAQVTVGPVIHLNVATQQWKVNYPENYKRTPLLGLQAGMFCSYPVNEKFATRGELTYSGEGTRQRNPAFAGSGYLRLNFIRLALLAEYRLLDKLYLEAGPNIGLFLSGKEKGAGETATVSDLYKPVDAGITLGTGYDFSERLKGFTAAVRLYYGLTNIASVDNQTHFGFKSRVISLAVRYNLSLNTP